MFWRYLAAYIVLSILFLPFAWASQEAARNHLERAHRCVDENALDRAEKHVRRSLKLHSSIRGRVFLGWLFKKTKRSKEALAILRKTSIASTPVRVQRELKRLDQMFSPQGKKRREEEKRRRERRQQRRQQRRRPRKVVKKTPPKPTKKTSAPPPVPADTTSKEFLLGGLTSASYEVKRHSMLELARLGYKDTLDRVAQLLQHPNELVRGGAAEALGKFGDDKGVVPLLEALWAEKKVPLAIKEIEALEKIGTEKALNGLYQYRYDNERPIAVTELDFALDRLYKKHKKEED